MCRFLNTLFRETANPRAKEEANITPPNSFVKLAKNTIRC